MGLVGERGLNLRQVAILLVIAIASLGLLATWVGVPVDAGSCYEDPTPEGEAFVHRATLVHFVAALALMGVIAWFSARRGGVGRPGRPTLVGLSVAFAYAVLSLLVNEVFVAAGILGLAFLVGYGVGPLLAAVAIAATAWWSRENGPDRATALFAWLVLALALPGNMAFAWAAGNPPIFC